MTTHPPNRRRWLTFSLRTFLIGSTLASLAIWGLVSWLRPVEQEVRVLPGGLVWREQTELGAPDDPFGGGKHGESVLRDKQGRLLFFGRNSHGWHHGRWRHYHANGRLALEGHCDQGAAVGTWTVWDERGNRRLEVTYLVHEKSPPDPFSTKQSTQTGPCRQWWASGRLKFEGQMREDQRSGVWTFWDEDGHQTAAGTYRDGLRVGEWQLADTATGETRFAWYINGRKIPDREALLAKLAADLRSNDRATRFDAVTALGELGPPAAPILAVALSPGDVPLALWTLRTLVSIGPDDPAVNSAIAKLRASPDQELRREALVALLLLDRTHRAKNLKELLGEASPTDEAVAQTWHVRLAELGVDILPALGEALENPDANMRWLAVSVLAEIVYPMNTSSYRARGREASQQGELIRILQRAQADQDPEIARAAKEILEFHKQVLDRQKSYQGGIPVVG